MQMAPLTQTPAGPLGSAGRDEQRPSSSDLSLLLDDGGNIVEQLRQALQQRSSELRLSRVQPRIFIVAK